ncbi:LysR family transcriptional regulator [Mesorhizobium sp.]|uniref:LysR family transcriptional regulator n=1 Tax=Mesorhizobium sp. TaxID=1871066 RepID=UPI000FEA4433|nr:LysR family transcriptional regulator [Mesorhizobium sp.]RWP99103.1 MAG: LysR family transcriptional regulator [Mesorhizobium sp.]RWQ27610.1 MAG: LysR family transcriptional regulator [Mesorhizobium sp.]
MSTINHFNLRSFDLNLLIAFDAMIRDRSVTKAAARLKVRQPAMSHSLAALRMLLDDELFIRVGNSMEPTAKALTVAAQVSNILEESQKLILARESFDPANSDRTFRIGFSCEELLLLPDLVVRLGRSGPGLKAIARRVVADEAGEQLDEGVIDIAIGPFSVTSTRHRCMKLFDQYLSCCFNADLLGGTRELDLERYLSAQHGLVSLRDGLHGCMGRMLSEAGYELNAVMAAPEYLSALAAASAAPLVVTLPRQIAERYAGRFGLTVARAPVDVELPPVSMVWSTKTDREPAAIWLREQIISIVNENGLAAGYSLEHLEIARPRAA